MTKRPIGVTVVGWIVAISGGYGVWSLYPVLTRATPGVSVTQKLVALASALIVLTSGIGILKARNWGRIAYVVVVPLFALEKAMASGFQANLLPGLGLYAIIVVVLFTPKASVYFASRVTAE